MKTRVLSLLASAALASGAAAAEAQVVPVHPLSFELRAGAAFPGEFNEGLSTGWTVTGNAIYQATPTLGVYAGYTLSSFGYDEADGVRFQMRGVGAGVRAGFGAAGFRPYVQAGLAYQQPAVSGGGTAVSGDHHLGLEVGAGLDYALGQRISVTPGVSYTRIRDEGVTPGYVKLDVGMRFRI